MPRDFLLPELAESVVEGEIVKWLVEEGETVAEDQPLVEVMTDKVTVELPSPFAGVLEQRLAQEGEVVAVHAPIARFADAGSSTGKPASSGAKSGAPSAAEVARSEAAAAAAIAGMMDEGEGPSEADLEQAADTQAAEERSIVESGAPEEDDGSSLSLFKPSDETESGPVFQVRSSRPAAHPTAQTTAQTTVKSTAPERPTGPYGRVLAVPAARKLARELGLELSEVEGSGPNGRIRVDDVRAHAERPPTRQAPSDPAPSRQDARPGAPRPEVKAPRHETPAGLEGLEERRPLRGLRRAISQQMLASHLGSVRTLHVDEADVSELVGLRERLKPLAERRGAKLSYLPFIFKAVAAGLKAFPMINASLDEARSEVVRKHYYNLGLAVATDAGLVVPVVRDADRKGLLELAEDIARLAGRAREGKLESADVKGGTFSVTNIGSLGGLFSFPIINVPEAAILGVHSIKKRPVVLPDDRIEARWMLYLSLSFDHRLIDGAEAAQFTSFVIEQLETPESLLL